MFITFNGTRTYHTQLEYLFLNDIFLLIDILFMLHYKQKTATNIHNTHTADMAYFYLYDKELALEC